MGAKVSARPDKVDGGSPTSRNQEAGRYIRTLREAVGLTQQELAARIGYSYYNFISAVEQGRSKVPFENHATWAQALGVDKKQFALNLLRYYQPEVYRSLDE